MFHLYSRIAHSVAEKHKRHGRKSPGVGYILQEFNGTWCRSKNSKDDLSSSMYIKVFTTLAAIISHGNWLVNKSNTYHSLIPTQIKPPVLGSHSSPFSCISHRSCQPCPCRALKLISVDSRRKQLLHRVLYVWNSMCF